MDGDITSLGTALSQDALKIYAKIAENHDKLQWDVTPSGKWSSLQQASGEKYFWCMQYKLFYYTSLRFMWHCSPLFGFFPLALGQVLLDVFGWFYSVVLWRESVPLYHVIPFIAVAYVPHDMIDSMFPWRTSSSAPCCSWSLTSVGFVLGFLLFVDHVFLRLHTFGRYRRTVQKSRVRYSVMFDCYGMGWAGTAQ